MRQTLKSKNTTSRNALSLALLAGMGCFCAVSPALASDAPFQFDAGRWMSSKSYNENLRRNILEADGEKEESAEPEKPFVSEIQIQPPAPPSVVVQQAPVPSTTAFLMPAMPGMNKGYDVRVNSTQEAEDKKIRLFTATHTPNGKLPESKWKTPSAKNLSAQEQEDEDTDNPPLKVRMSFLPVQNAPPIPSASAESALKKGHDLLRKNTGGQKKEPQKTPEEAAACAALDAYKKQQIDAIQGDRETLTALQKAIYSLGLEKKLGLMTEQGSSLNTPSNNASATPIPPLATDVR